VDETFRGAMKIPTTIKDVAKRTGLSLATISKYLNGGNVLSENRIKIEDAINELNFKVNAMARGLKTNKTMTIGVLIPDFKQIFCTTIASNIENILLQQGYSSIICDYREDLEIEKQKLQFLIDKAIDGLIIMPLGGDEDIIYELMKKELPIVIIDRALKDLKFDTVLIDNMNASYGAVEQLITRGHRRIGIITGPGSVYTAAERLKGYCRAHEDYSMPIDQDLIKFGNNKISGGHELMLQFLDLDNPPTAVFVTNYEMTVGAVMAINERNIIVPEQLSVIGFDSFELSKVVKPTLSVVYQPLEKIGEVSAELILKRVKGDFTGFPVLQRLKTEMVISESVHTIN
jgi:LacI family transcriptional regulator